MSSIQELEQEVATWKTYAAEIGLQLAAARKEIERLKSAAPKKEKAETPGFDAFWAAYPAGPRKVNKRACLTRWHVAKLEGKAQEIVDHVEACKAGRDWCKDGGAFVPAPLVYLNQERYLAPIPRPDRKPGSIAGMNYKPTGVDNDGHFA